MTQLKVKVVRKKLEADGIASFELARADGGPLPAFSAGSHIDVHVPGGLTRQYSLCNEPSMHHTYRIAVLRDAKSRGGSAGMHDAVKEGDVLEISEPRNHFPLVHAVRTILFAGGIGITPLLCMAHRLAHVGSDFELHYSTRSKSKTAFFDEIAASPFAGRTHFHFDDNPAEPLQLGGLLANVDSQTHLYVCGPAGFIQFVTDWAKGCGWPAGQIHVEFFAAPDQDKSGDRPFDVKIASSGQVIPIAADQTIVKALAAAGVEILTSCEQGVCGTCITRVLEGECDHRDMYFTDEEKAKHDQFTPCCSRAKSAVLVLDL
ncbi:PDR/VanB family oxidoreductase [Ramlibacter sp. PS4R-6]|uniref:PDR/VanB family oxidoreductase n=1 Tax=Ramlibacter sp. PS4R-6 TaxID=3133438 RepID=UPI0030AEF042